MPYSGVLHKPTPSPLGSRGYLKKQAAKRLVGIDCFNRPTTSSTYPPEESSLKNSLSGAHCFGCSHFFFLNGNYFTQPPTIRDTYLIDNEEKDGENSFC